MSKKEKLIQRVRSFPKDLRFEEFDLFLEFYNYKCINTTGSHYEYIDNYDNQLTVPKKREVSVVYIKLALKQIDSFHGDDLD